MRLFRHAVRISAAVLAFSLASAASAPAQGTAPYGTRVPSRGPSQAAIDRALREFGFNPATLRRDQQRALDSAWSLLFPETNRYRSVLNSSQATALVYVALVHGRERDRWSRGTGRGGWDRGDADDGRDRGGWNRGDSDNDDDDDDDDRGDRWDDGREGRGGAACVDVNRRVYDVENALNSGSGRSSLFVDDVQKREIRSAAREVQRLAVERGWRRVADRASEVIAAVAESMPTRETVSARVQALKRAADESCGDER